MYPIPYGDEDSWGDLDDDAAPDLIAASGLRLQVSVDVEGAIYSLAARSGITLFTVSHRKSLWQYHSVSPTGCSTRGSGRRLCSEAGAARTERIPSNRNTLVTKLAVVSSRNRHRSLQYLLRFDGLGGYQFKSMRDVTRRDDFGS